jgi:hypothetical protein
MTCRTKALAPPHKQEHQQPPTLRKPLTRITSIPKQRPKGGERHQRRRRCPIHGFWVFTEEHGKGVGRRYLGSASREERGTQRASPPSWPDRTTKGSPTPTNPTSSPTFSRADETPAGRSESEGGKGLPMTLLSSHYQNPATPRHPRGQDNRTADVYARVCSYR